MGLSYIFKPSEVDSTTTEELESEIIQCSGESGRVSQKGRFTRLSPDNSTLASVRQLHKPRIQGINSKGVMLFLPGRGS